MIIHKLQGWYTICSYGCIVDKVNPKITLDLQDASNITYWVNNILLSLSKNIITIKFLFFVTTVPKGLLLRTIVLIICPLNQWILEYLIIFGEIGNLVAFRRESVCVVEFWGMLIHMLVSFIDIINHLIHTRLVYVPESHQAHEWLEEVVHHMYMAEEQGIFDVILDPPIKIIIHL